MLYSLKVACRSSREEWREIGRYPVAESLQLSGWWDIFKLGSTALWQGYFILTLRLSLWNPVHSTPVAARIGLSESLISMSTSDTGKQRMVYRYLIISHCLEVDSSMPPRWLKLMHISRVNLDLRRIRLVKLASFGGKLGFQHGSISGDLVMKQGVTRHYCQQATWKGNTIPK